MALLGQQLREDESTVKPESRVEPPLPPAAPVRSPDSMRGLEPMAMTQKPAESILAAGMTIEGKIEGNGTLRVAGRFKGHINVNGQLTIEAGASIDGEVKADTVLVVGEVHGNIVSKSRVELRALGALIGDLKAGSLTVAAGSRMQGQVECGWKDAEIDEQAPAEAQPGVAERAEQALRRISLQAPEQRRGER